jgi:very-short-patch-repair endonuclease
MPNENARTLRRNMTDAERALWRLLRSGHIEGHRFRRQEPLDHYIVDFVCFDARLVIEVDGGQHFESKSDAKRDTYLRSQGFRVLRFWNNDVLSNPDGVYHSRGVALTLRRFACAPVARAPSSSSGYRLRQGFGGSVVQTQVRRSFSGGGSSLRSLSLHNLLPRGEKGSFIVAMLSSSTPLRSGIRVCPNSLASW